MSSKKVATSVAGTIVKITIYALLIVFIYTMSSKAYEFGYKIFKEEAISVAPGRTVSVAIVEGKTVMEVGEILEEKGLIHNAKVFYFQEKFSEYAGDLQPGVYELSTAMTPQEMMAVMAVEPTTTEE